ncbi:cytochrome c oxidase-assembly factor, mitocondorial [Talaromyces pinophilus]|uniref:Cytochrome c oxidase assembly protein COX16, mitochondrial n=1 Tax=Talaromyces pinophilus TaxID=128442 RepID=A0A0B8N1X5_TALPI|nr:cytochrome c oxidase-assembly factor, mitocondorial [Talaromyces pinophilus]
MEGAIRSRLPTIFRPDNSPPQYYNDDDISLLFTHRIVLILVLIVLIHAHPFLLFGLPFITVIVAASFVLTPATALRYERHDRRVRQLDQEEAMALGLKGENGEESISRNPRRRIVGSDREEYYKLMAKDLDDWEQTRVKRLKGEPDGRFD